ncbi:MAG: hypothetical protein ACJ780_31580 [Solirubrobacteraceae bacterium]
MSIDTNVAVPIVRVLDYVNDATIVYRKGEVITINSDGGTFTVVTIDNFPALPQGTTTTVDCHFVDVGFTEALAKWSHEEFYDAVMAAESGIFATMTPERWAAGPSYREIGGWIGDQSDAFKFMACVQAHGLGEVITPKRLHITDEVQANTMAGLGYVLLSGLKNPREE